MIEGKTKNLQKLSEEVGTWEGEKKRASMQRKWGKQIIRTMAPHSEQILLW